MEEFDGALVVLAPRDLRIFFIRLFEGGDFRIKVILT